MHPLIPPSFSLLSEEARGRHCTGDRTACLSLLLPLGWLHCWVRHCRSPSETLGGPEGRAALGIREGSQLDTVASDMDLLPGSSRCAPLCCIVISPRAPAPGEVWVAESSKASEDFCTNFYSPFS